MLYLIQSIVTCVSAGGNTGKGSWPGPRTHFRGSHFIHKSKGKRNSMKNVTDVLEAVRGDHEPQTGFVYVMLSAEGTFLYIGQTTQPLAVRIRGHFQERPSLIRSTAKLEAEELPVNTLLDTEAHLIHEHHPIMNRLCPVEDCYHYVNSTTRRRNPLKPALSDSELADTVHEAINLARQEGQDRVFSADLLDLIDARHPRHNLKPGQIRQKITAALGDDSKVIYDSTTKKMARGWYLSK